MSYQSFENQWKTHRVDYDHVYQYQCVDLILQYVHQVYGLTGVSGNAIDYWTKTSPNLYKKFSRVGPQRAKTGDILVFHGLPGNPYGHIAIAHDGNYMLEQNGQTGNGSGVGGDAIRLRAIPYTRLAGILRPKTVAKVIAAVAPPKVYWTVRSGDTLGYLAGRFHTTVARIASLNSIKNVNLIYVGQKLRIK